MPQLDKAAIEEFRRERNEQGAASDRTGLQRSAALFGGLLLFKTALQEGLPGLALLASSHVLMAQALALLISCRPQLYIRYREAFAIALMLNLAWVVRILALHGGTPILKYHDGSTLKLLLLMVAGSPSFWVCIYALHSRPLLRWMRLALPLLAVLPLWSNPRICRRALGEVPGIEESMDALHSNLSLWNIASAPATYLLTCGECSPLQQCVAITHSIVLSLGVLLPLCLLEQLERRARRHFAARQRLQRQQAQQLERRRQQRERQEQQEQEHRLAQVLQQALAEEAEEDAAERWEAAGGSLERHLLLAGQPVEAILSTQFLASCLAWLGANALAKWPT